MFCEFYSPANQLAFCSATTAQNQVQLLLCWGVNIIVLSLNNTCCKFEKMLSIIQLLATLLLFLSQDVQGVSLAEDLILEEPIINLHLPVLPKRLSKPIFYTTFFPVIFEYQLPQWEQADLRLKWPSGHSTGCNNSESISYHSQVGCPSVYHYNSVIGKFFDNTEQMAFGSPQHDVYNGSPMLPISCEEISAHFGNEVSTSSISWDNYWKLLSSCPIRDFHKESVTTINAKIDLTKLDYMLKRFFDLYANSAYNHYQSVGGSVYTTSYSAYQVVGLLEHFVEMQRWSDSISLCNSGKLPRHLVGYSKLEMTLNLVKAKINSKLYDLSTANTGKYYKMPVTDCVRSAKNTSLVIRMLVPIKPSKANFTLVDLLSIPFTQDFNASSPSNLVCRMDDFKGSYVVDSTSGFIEKSQCKSTELCFINEKYNFFVDPCLSAILNGGPPSADLDLQTCKINCQTASTNKFPLFSRLSSDIIAIVGYSPDKYDIFISCKGNPFKVIKPHETGTLLVQLSCECKIVYQFQEFYAQEPCNSTMKLQHISFASFKSQKVTKPDDLEINADEFETTQKNSNLYFEVKEQNIDNVATDYWMLYFAFVFGLFGLVSFIWHIIETVVRGRNKGNNEIVGASNFANVAYTINSKTGEELDNQTVYLVRK